MNSLMYYVLAVASLIIVVAFWGTVGWVAWHFISKYW